METTFSVWSRILRSHHVPFSCVRKTVKQFKALAHPGASFFALLIFVLFAMSSSVSAQQSSRESLGLKIGYVSSDVILQQYPDAVEAQKKLESLAKGWQDELEKMTKELQEKYAAYQKKEGMMTEQAKLQEQQKLLAKEQEINDFRMKKFGQNGELAQQQDKIMRPIRDKIFKAIAAVAKEEGVSFVFDKSEQLLVLLYAESRYDLTFKVLDRLRRGE